MRVELSVIEVNSPEFNSLFTPDGKLDFKARKGLDRDSDPLSRVNFSLDYGDNEYEIKNKRKALKHEMAFEDA